LFQKRIRNRNKKEKNDLERYGRDQINDIIIQENSCLRPRAKVVLAALRKFNFVVFGFSSFEPTDYSLGELLLLFSSLKELAIIIFFWSI
jgi:hypothetical protein